MTIYDLEVFFSFFEEKNIDVRREYVLNRSM